MVVVAQSCFKSKKAYILGGKFSCVRNYYKKNKPQVKWLIFAKSAVFIRKNTMILTGLNDG